MVKLTDIREKALIEIFLGYFLDKGGMFWLIFRQYGAYSKPLSITCLAPFFQLGGIGSNSKAALGIASELA
ncbi:Uncharacterised protein [Vibrio cholerae]|nr:Uncharacterised protein [Vibrio cholerae]CSI38563.1 Uncharacterised protein [Vibrio cholerae]